MYVDETTKHHELHLLPLPTAPHPPPRRQVRSACAAAIEGGAAVFFDPGPRCASMLEGGRREALDALLDLSAVVLMTEVRGVYICNAG